MLKSQFPIFTNNPGLIYLDSASSTQKPQSVMDAVNYYISTNYANLGRWEYNLAINSEDIYHQSKIKIAKLINAQAKNIIYTPGTTYGYNMIAQSLIQSWILKKWDKIMLSISEHHANLLPWQYLSKNHGIQIIYIWLDEYGQLDMKDFESKYTSDIKIISLSTVSNVLWIVNLEAIKQIKQSIHEDTIIIADASQTLGHMYTDVQNLWIDIMIWGGHKMMAYTGIWCIYMTDKLLKTMVPPILGGWIVDYVDFNNYGLLGWSDSREAWTPNIIWAVSIWAAADFLWEIWWYEYIQKHSQKMVDYRDNQINTGKLNAQMIYKYNPDIARISLFSIKDIYIRDILWHELLTHNICIRQWWHCAQPLHQVINNSKWSIRISPYIYNDLEDLDKMIYALNKSLK